MKTSISLSADLLAEIDRVSEGVPRSAFIERVMRAYLDRRSRAESDARDLALIDSAADRLNAEMEDVLLYQVILDE